MSDRVTELKDFAARYTAAWCGQDAARVAAFFADDGTLTINDNEPAVGRRAIADTTQVFMTAFPDLQVAMDELVVQGDLVEYRWTLTGTNTGHGGKGNAVHISGVEHWEFDHDGLIRASHGRFDSGEYRRQLAL